MNDYLISVIGMVMSIIVGGNARSRYVVRVN